MLKQVILVNILIFIIVESKSVPFNKSEDQYIIGGNEVNITQYPYQAAIHMFGRHFCGAAIITKNALLTAAHCVSAFHESILSVIVGSSFTHSGGEIIGIKSRHVHPDFNKLPADYDIAVVILEKDLVFSESVKTIALQILPALKGEEAIVSGWGKTETSSNSEHLLAATIRISDQKECFQNYQEAGYNMTERMLCAGLPNVGIDACTGDSGGPLLCKRSNKLCGIVSFGRGCALEKYPGVYTKISKLRKWILKFL